MFAGIAISLTLLLAPTLTTAPTTQFVADATLATRLAAIDAKAGAHRDLVASFVQDKISPLLQEPIVTRGVVHARGDVMLWASHLPERTRMRVDPERLRIYYEKQRAVEEFPVQSQLGAMASSPLPRLATLEERFAIRVDDGKPLANNVADTLQLRLDPTDAAIKPYVDHVRVLLDASRGLVRVFEVTDPDGETTRVTFGDVKTDTDFPESDLALDAPANATISKPLEAK